MSTFYGRHATLVLDKGRVVLEGQKDGSAEPPLRIECAAAELEGGDHDRRLMEVLGLVPVLEARAFLALDRDPGPPVTPLGPRPSVERIVSFGRGDPRCVWITGRKVSAMAGEARYDGTFEEFLATGFAAPLASQLGEACVAQVTAGVRALAPLTCMCETGALTDSQHGALRGLSSGSDWNSPVDDHGSVAQCLVCGRIWTFEESGDSHYSYHYSADRFPTAWQHVM